MTTCSSERFEARRPTGQGLGLAIAHRLVSARGGSIELVDGHQPGATFVARLPRREAVDVVRNTSRSQFRILIVEDHVLFAESLEPRSR